MRPNSVACCSLPRGVDGHRMGSEAMRVCLPPELGSIGFARTLVREAAQGMESEVVEDAVLLTSELVTNAIQHGGSRIELVTDTDHEQLVVAVYDDGDAFRSEGGERALPGVTATSGRGLRMVHRVARSWGVDTDDDAHGKTVWFRLDRRRETLDAGPQDESEG